MRADIVPLCVRHHDEAGELALENMYPNLGCCHETFWSRAAAQYPWLGNAITSTKMDVSPATGPHWTVWTVRLDDAYAEHIRVDFE